MSARTRHPALRRLAVTAAAAALLIGLTDAAPAGGGVSTGHVAAVWPGPLSSTAYAVRSLPDRIGVRPKVQQLITVTSRTWSTQRASLRAWQRDGRGRWRLARGPLPARIGYNGWVRGDQRVQSSGTTPAGRYRLPYAFGRLPDPGAKLGYRRFDRTDWWPYEPRQPATYNVWQWHKAPTSHWRRDKAEHLWDFGAQYAYGVVIGFNLPSGIHYSHRMGQWVADRRADTGRGGGIFLHVRDDGPTAGCVSISRDQLRWLIRWLRPGGHPHIYQGPYRYVVNL